MRASFSLVDDPALGSRLRVLVWVLQRGEAKKFGAGRRWVTESLGGRPTGWPGGSQHRGCYVLCTFVAQCIVLRALMVCLEDRYTLMMVCLPTVLVCPGDPTGVHDATSGASEGHTGTTIRWDVAGACCMCRAMVTSYRESCMPRAARLHMRACI